MKKIVIGAFLAVILVASCVCLFVNTSFPLANAATCPDEKDINSFSVSRDNEAIELSDMSFGSMVVYIEIAEPTRQASVDDTPSVSSYFRITLDTDAQRYTYYLYEEGDTAYLEIPYEGVYIINEEALALMQ